MEILAKNATITLTLSDFDEMRKIIKEQRDALGEIERATQGLYGIACQNVIERWKAKQRQDDEHRESMPPGWRI